jgi:hypothetical protein
VKFEPLVAVPDGVVTEIRPVVAPGGTVAMTRSSLTKLNAADTPFKRTAFTPVNRFPLTVTAVPTFPLVGEKLLIVGPLPLTVKFEELVAVPAPVVTVILPVVAPEGTVAVTRSSLTKLNAADTPLKRTAFTPVKLFPLIVTDVPTEPLEGEKLLIVGALSTVTVKFEELVAVPDGVERVILPVVALAGTVVFTCPAETKLKVAVTPLKRTAFTPVKLLPVMVTAVPGPPLVGENPLIVG